MMTFEDRLIAFGLGPLTAVMCGWAMVGLGVGAAQQRLWPLWLFALCSRGLFFYLLFFNTTDLNGSSNHITTLKGVSDYGGPLYLTWFWLAVGALCLGVAVTAAGPWLPNIKEEDV